MPGVVRLDKNIVTLTVSKVNANCIENYTHVLFPHQLLFVIAGIKAGLLRTFADSYMFFMILLDMDKGNGYNFIDRRSVP